MVHIIYTEYGTFYKCFCKYVFVDNETGVFVLFNSNCEYYNEAAKNDAVKTEIASVNTLRNLPEDIVNYFFFSREV